MLEAFCLFAEEYGIEDLDTLLYHLRSGHVNEYGSFQYVTRDSRRHEKLDVPSDTTFNEMTVIVTADPLQEGIAALERYQVEQMQPLQSNIYIKDLCNELRLYYEKLLTNNHTSSTP